MIKVNFPGRFTFSEIRVSVEARCQDPALTLGLVYFANNRILADRTRYTFPSHASCHTFAASTTRLSRSFLAGHSSRDGFQFPFFHFSLLQTIEEEEEQEGENAREGNRTERELKDERRWGSRVSRINDLDSGLYGSAGLPEFVA